MGALKNKLGQSASLEAAELQTRRELSVLEDLRNAVIGAPLSAEPIICYAEDVARSGDAGRGLQVLEAAASHPRSFSKEDFDFLRLAKARMQSALKQVPRTTIEDLESLINDDEALADHRAQALICLAEMSGVRGDYKAATSVLTSQRTDDTPSVYWAPAVVLARATYAILAGDFSSALQDTGTLMDRPSALTASQMRQGRIQHAWALTQLGRFDESNEFIHHPNSQYGRPNALRYIEAWNQVGAKNISLREALIGSSFTLEVHPEESEWSQSFFKAWSALAENNLDQALETFTALPTGPDIEPDLNGTLDELALLGKAHTLLELGNYDAAYDAFQRLSASVPDQPIGERLQIIMAAQCYGLLSAKLNSVAAIEKVSAARRCAQISFGLASPLVPRLMDVEAELLLADGRSAEARASRVIALELIDKGGARLVKERLSHELGLYLVDAHENKNCEALSGLRSIIPTMTRELGPHHEKTIIARYALISLTDPSDLTATDSTAFEDLYGDLVRTFGATHILSLKARYGLARRLSLKGNVPDALALYTSIKALLPALPQNLKFKISVERRVGDSHRSLGQYEAAHGAYSSALGSLKASIDPSSDRLLEIQLDIHECLVKRGLHRQAMNFFSSTASRLRETQSEPTTEYFRAVHGYAYCLELLHNHAGSAHNYGHLVRLLDEGMHPEGLECRAQIYVAAGWNSELAKNFIEAATLYEKALVEMKEADTLVSDSRRVDDLEHRLLCCTARLAA